MADLKTKLAQLTPSRRFLIVAVYLSLIYATLPIAPDVVLSLRELNLLTAFVTTLYLTMAATILWLMLFLYRIRDFAAYALMSCVALIFGYFVLGLEVQEERVHFVQYGLLAVAVAYSLRPYFDGVKLYVFTFVATSAAGIFDEMLQKIVPVRYFDWRDIQFNIIAAAGGTLFCWILRTYLMRPKPSPRYVGD